MAAYARACQINFPALLTASVLVTKKWQNTLAFYFKALDPRTRFKSQKKTSWGQPQTPQEFKHTSWGQPQVP